MKKRQTAGIFIFMPRDEIAWNQHKNAQGKKPTACVAVWLGNKALWQRNGEGADIHSSGKQNSGRCSGT